MQIKRKLYAQKLYTIKGYIWNEEIQLLSIDHKFSHKNAKKKNYIFPLKEEISQNLTIKNYTNRFFFQHSKLFY